MVKLGGVLVGAALLLAGPGQAATPWEAGLVEVDRHLNAGLEAYRSGDAAAADQHFSDVYFVAYEASGLEIAVRQFISAKRNYQLEKMFRNLRLLVQQEADPALVETQIGDLRRALAEDVERLRNYGEADFFAGGGEKVSTGLGSGSAFVQSLLIIFREGFEAMLLVGALAAYLQRAGRVSEIRVLYVASAAAVAASLLTAYLLHKLLPVPAAGQEVVEGLTMLLASAVLFYVSYWLISKTQSRRWQGYIQGKVEAALGRDRVVAMGAAAFLAVYREGAETVLFYKALLAGTTGAAREIWGGFAAGALSLLVLFMAFRRAIGKLPVGPFFAVTGAFLYYLGFVFAGKGVHELQEGGLLGDTTLTFVPHVEPLGLFPSLEGVLVQSLFVVAAALVAIRWLWTARAAQGRAGIES